MSKIESLIVACIALFCFLGGLTVGDATSTKIYAEKIDAVAGQAGVNNALLQKLEEDFRRLQTVCNVVAHDSSVRETKKSRKDEEVPWYRKLW